MRPIARRHLTRPPIPIVPVPVPFRFPTSGRCIQHTTVGFRQPIGCRFYIDSAVSVVVTSGTGTGTGTGTKGRLLKFGRIGAMRHRWALCLTILLAAVVVAAQSPESTASRRAFLWRALDSWSLPIPQAVMMQQDPFASVRAQAAGVMASNVDPKMLPLLTRYMNDGDARVREQVMLAAGRMGKPGLQLAVHGLADSTPLVRQAAAWAVAHGGPEGFEPLSRHLAKERSRAVRETLLANLWRLEGAPWQASAALFTGDNDVHLRRAAAYSLSRSSDQDARAAQRRFVTDPEPVIRATALRGFEKGTLDEKDVAALQIALADDDWRVRAAACRALAAQEPAELSPEAAQKIVAAFSSPHPHLAFSAVAAADTSDPSRDRQSSCSKSCAAMRRGSLPRLWSLSHGGMRRRRCRWQRGGSSRTICGAVALLLGPRPSSGQMSKSERWRTRSRPSDWPGWPPSTTRLSENAGMSCRGWSKTDPDPAVRASILSLLRPPRWRPVLKIWLASTHRGVATRCPTREPKP